MKNTLKSLIICLFALVVGFGFVGCEKSGSCSIAEQVTLAKTTLGEVEFENSENVKLKQDCDKVIVSGEIDSISVP